MQSTCCVRFVSIGTIKLVFSFRWPEAWDFVWSTMLAMWSGLVSLIWQESSSTSSSSSGINYEVFLSFRGVDTRKGFTDHLYSKLVDAGIQVFKDDKKLRAGEEIKQELKEVIKRSRISVAILSKDYASSRSCLMEVVQMWECRKLNGQTIIPVFYDISPFNVKRQAGDFGTSFEKHEQDGVSRDSIKKWKKVLRKIGELSGFNREDINGG